MVGSLTAGAYFPDWSDDASGWTTTSATASGPSHTHTYSTYSTDAASTAASDVTWTQSIRRDVRPLPDQFATQYTWYDTTTDVYYQTVISEHVTRDMQGRLNAAVRHAEQQALHELRRARAEHFRAATHMTAAVRYYCDESANWYTIEDVQLTPYNPPDTEAEKKAQELLEKFIGSDELKVYNETGRLFVKGEKGTYIVRKHGSVQMIEEDKIIDLCVHIKGKHECPPTDNVVALMLEIETDEDRILELANRIGTEPLPEELPLAACM